METKVCYVCKTEKDHSEFHRCKRNKDGFQQRCIACHRAYYEENKEASHDRSRAWREANPERYEANYKAYYRENPKPEYHAAYRAENREACNARSADWTTRNPDRKLASSIAWNAANPEKRKINDQNWRAANPDKACEKTMRHLAAKLQACPAWADIDKILSFYTEAARLSKETGIKHHVDHIVPLQSKWVSGLHVHHNLRVIPGSDNVRKSNKYWPDMPDYLRRGHHKWQELLSPSATA